MKCHFHNSWGPVWSSAWVSLWRRIRQHGFTEFIIGMACRIYILYTSSEKLLCSNSTYSRGLLSSWSPLWKPQTFLIIFFACNIVLLSTVNTKLILWSKRVVQKKWMWVKTALFWVITQRVVAITYRRFGTNYLFHLQWSRILFGFLTIEYRNDTFTRNVGKELPLLGV